MKNENNKNKRHMRCLQMTCDQNSRSYILISPLLFMPFFHIFSYEFNLSNQSSLVLQYQS